MTGKLSVGVALCTYNGAAYLPALLESLAEQDRRPDELVVCDDGSSDNTIEVVRAFAARAPFPVAIHENETNLGATKNFEKAIGLCTTDLISLCDQDDIWGPKKIARAVEAFETDPELGFTFSDAELIDEDGTLLGKRLWEAVGFTGERRSRAEGGELLQLLVLYTFVTGATLVFRARLRDLVLPIPTDWVHDAWIALLSSFVSTYRLIAEPLMLYRIHAEQQIGVPDAYSDDPVETRWTKWKLRLRQVPDVSGAASYRANRRTLAYAYESAADRFETAATRYLASSGTAPNPEAQRTLVELRERAEHLKARGNLPDARTKRVPIVLREWRAGRYRKFSAGIASAVQDVLY